LCCVNIMNVKPLPPIDDDPAPTKPGAR
jgi:hypothetical protein